MADIDIWIGRPYRILSDEYVLEAQHFAAELARQTGFFVDLHIHQYVPRQRGMTPVQWIGMTVATGAALKAGSDLWDAVFNEAKVVCRRLRERTGRHHGVRMSMPPPDADPDGNPEPAEWSTMDEDASQRPTEENGPPGHDETPEGEQ